MEPRIGSSGTTESLLLPLRVWPKQGPDQGSLSSIIRRIHDQKGQFRHVTESSLEEEIQAQQSEDSDHVDEVATKDGEDAASKSEDEASRREFLLSAKEEILKQVGQAYMEAYYALDFVSLLLSKDGPRPNDSTMSAYLKEHVPPGSLDAVKVQKQPESAAAGKNREMVQMGWKLQSLNSSADTLIESASRLAGEIEQETRYWEQILAIDQSNWSLCRMPRERHTLGVRFGFLEAAAEFRDRGLAALRRGEGGKVVLDQGLVRSVPKAVRVRIATGDDVVVGSSAVPAITDAETSSIEDLILQARNAIYEEELFHEINREARILTNQGVRIVDSKVIIALPDDHVHQDHRHQSRPDRTRRYLRSQGRPRQRQVWIDLVPLAEGISSWENDAATLQDSHTGPENSKGDIPMAEAIALSIRILLSNAHRQNRRRRSQIPVPLTERKKPSPPYSILRPVMTHLFHRSAIDSVRALLQQSVVNPLRLAELEVAMKLDMGINCSLPFSPPASSSSSFAGSSSSSSKDMRGRHGEPDGALKKSAMEEVIETFSTGIESRVEITLPGPSVFEIMVRTRFSAPILGTEYAVSASSVSFEQADGAVATNDFSSPSTSPPTTRTFVMSGGGGGADGTNQKMHLRSIADLERYLHHLTTLALVSETQTYHLQQHQQQHRSMRGDDGKSQGSGEGKGIESIECTSINELTVTYAKTSRSKLFAILVSERGVEIQWRWMNGRIAPAAGGSRTRRQNGVGQGQENMKDVDEEVLEEGRYLWPVLGDGDGHGHGTQEVEGGAMGKGGYRSFKEVVGLASRYQ